MSIVVAVKGPSGLALAADSRRTVFVGSDPQQSEGPWHYLTWDGDEKVFGFSPPHSHIGLLLYGVMRQAFEPTSLLVAEVESRLPERRLSVLEYARHGREVLAARAARADGSLLPFQMHAIVAGYDEDGTARVYTVEFPGDGAPVEQHTGGLGITYGGMRELIDRLLAGYDSALLEAGAALDSAKDLDALHLPIALSTMSIKDSVELAMFLVRTTIEGTRFLGPYGLQGVGGPIDAATITPEEGFRFAALKVPTAVEPIRHQCEAERPVVQVSTPAEIDCLASYSVALADSGAPGYAPAGEPTDRA